MKALKALCDNPHEFLLSCKASQPHHRTMYIPILTNTMWQCDWKHHVSHILVIPYRLNCLGASLIKGFNCLCPLNLPCQKNGDANLALHGVWVLALHWESECPRASQLILSRTLIFEQPRSGAPRSRIQSFDFTLEVAKIWQTITVVINQLQVLIFQNSISLLILLKNMKVTKKPFIIVCIISKFKWHVDEIEMLKALAHYNWYCKKSSYRPYTLLQLFFTTAIIFSTVLYMDNNFYKDFFQKNLCENLCSVRGP